jgi:predicted RNA-binding protein with RPS1 domain
VCGCVLLCSSRLQLSSRLCRAQVHGYVSGVNKAGAFVALRGGATAHVKLSHLADGYVESPAQEFPIGKHVRGHITAKEGSRWGSACRV